MIPMNQWVEPRIKPMMDYLENLATHQSLRENAFGKKVKRSEAEPQLAKLVEMYGDAVVNNKNEDLKMGTGYHPLNDAINEIENHQLKEYDVPIIIHQAAMDSPMRLKSSRSSINTDLMRVDDDLNRTMTINPSKTMEFPKIQRRRRESRPEKSETIYNASQENIHQLTMTRGQENHRMTTSNYDLFIPKEDDMLTPSSSIQQSRMFKVDESQEDVELSDNSKRSSRAISQISFTSEKSHLSAQIDNYEKDLDEALKSLSTINTSSVINSRSSTPKSMPSMPNQLEIRKSQGFEDMKLNRKSAPESTKIESKSNSNTIAVLPKVEKPSLKSLFSVIETAVSNANQINHQINEIILCTGCKTTIDGTYLLIDGRPFHSEHFTCFECKMDCKNGGKLFDDKLFCLNHYAQVSKDKVCYRCDIPFKQTDQMVKALNHLWHSTCFTCVVCDCALTKGFVPHDELPYCKEHYMRFMGMVCDYCGDVIENEYLTINNKKYHTNCRKCLVCQQSIAGRNYVLMNENCYCQEHFESILKCMRCGFHIKEGEYISIPMRDKAMVFHTQHFTCELCEVELTPKTYYLTSSSNVRCRQCIFSTE
eukprot:NODE_517_length_6557_cov_0.431558.p2 type:complete len:593 gc:universal NODE_517_length_6557_cov_0.431558:3767-1989(-)